MIEVHEAHCANPECGKPIRLVLKEGMRVKKDILCNDCIKAHEHYKEKTIQVPYALLSSGKVWCRSDKQLLIGRINPTLCFDRIDRRVME